MKYYLVAGEASGDMHGALLIENLREQDKDAEIRFTGGKKMQEAAGLESDVPLKALNVMGFLEVVRKLGTIKKNLEVVKGAIAGHRPDVLVLIDFAGFNLRLASFAKRNNIKVAWYIAPKVWAWNERRVYKLKKWVDALFVILPFEEAFFEKFGVKAQYVGNPIADQVGQFTIAKDFRLKELPGTRPVIALLPGSRKQEIEALLPVMLQLPAQLPGFDFAIAATDVFNSKYYERLLEGTTVKVVKQNTYNLLGCATAAVVASGTATLETALLGVPEVVVYKTSAVSVFIGRLLLKIKYISLVNLILDKAVVKELIQGDYTVKNVLQALEEILPGQQGRNNMLAGFAELKKIVGGAGAGRRTAEGIIKLANGR